jgi:protocatechuate 3,4-dioxygenase beta subunit
LRYRPFSFFSIPPILLLIAVSQSAGAQTPQRDNRPRTASISGRVTIGGKPAANAVVTVEESDFKPDASGAEPPIPFHAKARTDGDGRYLVGGLAEGRYFVRAMLNAFVASNSAANSMTGRSVTLDEGETREKIDFALIRGGVITGKVLDDEGAPFIAKRVRLHMLNEKGEKNEYSGPYSYEMLETDDRGVYRIYGLPPGRYAISAGGETGGDPIFAGSGMFATTWYPDTTDEKQARIIEIKEGSEVTDIDIRLGSAIKTFGASGRVVDEKGKPVPRVYVWCSSKPGNDWPPAQYSTTAIADGQGNFKLSGLPPGSYQATVRDFLGDSGYTSDETEFEITNDNVSGVELKTFLGASLSGFVVIEGAGASDGNQFQSIMIFPSVTPKSDDGRRISASFGYSPVKVNADGGFVLKGIQAGGVSFWLYGSYGGLQIKRVERDGVEVKDAIEVKPGENVTGVRIVAQRALGRIRGQIQIAGGALPDNWRLEVHANRPASADEARPDRIAPVSFWGAGGGAALADDKGRFLIERLLAGEYDLSVNLSKPMAGGGWEGVPLSGLNQRVTLKENDEASVKITIDLNRISRPNNQPNNLNNLEDRR